MTKPLKQRDISVTVELGMDWGRCFDNGLHQGRLRGDSSLLVLRAFLGSVPETYENDGYLISKDG